MTMRKCSIVALAAVAVIAVPRTADAWSMEIHKFIMARAIPLLPPEIRPYFKKYEVSIVEHAVDPDLWRTAGFVEESPRHFVDMDAYGPYPFKELPHDYEQAVKRYGLQFVEKNGTLPWRAEGIYKKLVEAFAQKAPFARDNIRFFSSVLSHYTGDAHVPFHAALNHDGQLTGQAGLHSRFETELFERYQRQLHLEPHPPAPIANSREFIFETLTESFRHVQPILDADAAAVAGREFYDDEYFTRFFGKVQPILERRISDSIDSVAAMITSAWVAAGRPVVPVESRRTPRPVRRQ
jgi:hypothetical protein